MPATNFAGLAPAVNVKQAFLVGDIPAIACEGAGLMPSSLRDFRR